MLPHSSNLHYYQVLSEHLGTESTETACTINTPEVLRPLSASITKYFTATSTTSSKRRRIVLDEAQALPERQHSIQDVRTDEQEAARLTKKATTLGLRQRLIAEVLPKVDRKEHTIRRKEKDEASVDVHDDDCTVTSTASDTAGSLVDFIDDDGF